MPNRERKSSEDLVREAKERFNDSQTEPEYEVEAPSSDAVEHEVAGRERVESATAGSPGVSEVAPTEVPVANEQAGPIETPRKSGSGISPHVIRWGLVLLLVGGWFLFTRIDDASRAGSGEIVDSGDLNVMTMQEGDCFNDPEELEDVVFSVAAIPCSEPHDNEVFAVQSVAGTFSGDTYPGDDALSEHSYQTCSGGLFDSYVGTPYLDSALDVFTMTPTAESWDQGDREFVCILYRLDLGQLTDTAKGSGL